MYFLQLKDKIANTGKQFMDNKQINIIFISKNYIYILSNNFIHTIYKCIVLLHKLPEKNRFHLLNNYLLT